MRLGSSARTLPAIGLGFAILASSGISAWGQGVSSGSGSGTGTGRSSGSLGSTGTGRESSSGLGTTGTGREGLPGGLGQPGGRALTPDDLTRPVDRSGGANPGGGFGTVTNQLVLDARSVADAGERSLALIRIAQTAIFSKQLDVAHGALFEASTTALTVSDPLTREQRVTAIVDTLLRLAEERMSDNTDANFSLDDPVPDPRNPTAPPSDQPPKPPTPPTDVPGAAPSPSQSPAEAGAPQPPPGTAPVATPIAALPPDDRKVRLNAALPEWGQAVNLATKLDNVTARTEALFRIAESEAYSSQKLVNEPARYASGRPDPAALAPDLRDYTDLLLVNSAKHARMIERPIWRNSAFYSVVSNAAASSQFTRGFEIARSIEQPEARTDTLIRLAEGQALNARPNEATAAYLEAARSVSQIPQDDPRETLVGVLIDSLISYGRFDDARACVWIYAIPARQLVALSAIAESQGRRGLAASARIWIARDVPASFRPVLYRKVSDGELSSVEQNRSKDLSAGSLRGNSAPAGRPQ